MRLGTGICKAALGFEGIGAGGADAAQGARGGHPARQRCRGAAAMGPTRGSRRLPCPHSFVTGKTIGRKGKGGERRADRRGSPGSDQEERWMAGGLAGCIGPKGIGGLAV
jgi:hypothetical protein